MLRSVCRTASVLVSTLVLAAAPASAADEAISLHPDYQAGQTAKFAIDVTRTETTQIVQQPMEVKRTIKHQGEFDMKVVDASASGVTIALTLKKLVSTLEDPNRTLKFDSTAAPDDADLKNPLLMSLKPIVGATATLKFDEKGRVVECTTDAELVQQSQFTEFANQLIGEEWAKFRWAPVLYPKAEKGEAKVGDAWPVEQSLTVRLMGKLKTNMNLKLDAITAGAAAMSGEGEFSLEPEKEAEKSALKPEVFEPTLKMSYQAGVGTTRAEFHEKFKMAGDAQGMAFSRSTDTKFTVTRAK